MPAAIQVGRRELAELAQLEPKTIDKLRERARRRREQELPPLPNEIPEPDGYIGRSPYWWHGRGRPITRWLKNREVKVSVA